MSVLGFHLVFGLPYSHKDAGGDRDLWPVWLQDRVAAGPFLGGERGAEVAVVLAKVQGDVSALDLAATTSYRRS